MCRSWEPSRLRPLWVSSWSAPSRTWASKTVRATCSARLWSWNTSLARSQSRRRNSKASLPNRGETWGSLTLAQSNRDTVSSSLYMNSGSSTSVTCATGSSQTRSRRWFKRSSWRRIFSVLLFQWRNPSALPMWGSTGILLQETKHVFKIITKEDRLKVIPKLNCVFIIEIDGFISYIYGSNFQLRSSERSAKKFKVKGTIDLWTLPLVTDVPSSWELETP